MVSSRSGNEEETTAVEEAITRGMRSGWEIARALRPWVFQLLGLGFITLAGFLVSIPLGLTALGLALINYSIVRPQ